MRNTIAQLLPPLSELTIEIVPPMGEHERHYIVTPPTYGPVVVRLIDNAHVSISNQHDRSAFFVFTVGPVMNLPPGVAEAVSAFFSARKST